MSRPSGYAAVVALTIALAGAAGARGGVDRSYDRYARPGPLVAIEPGRRLNLRCSGASAAGEPTVLFESGLGFPSYSWRKVQPIVARFARACSYDRAGLGFSDAGPLPRTAGAIAHDLERLVDAAALKPPFVLVGSSLGSQSVRLFAFRHPSKVAGLVLVDPYVEGQYAAFDRIAPGILAANAAEKRRETECRDFVLRARPAAIDAERRGCIDPPDPAFSRQLAAVVSRQRASPASVEAAWSESDNLDAASEQDVTAARRSLGAVPIVILSAGRDFHDQGYSPAVEQRLLTQLTELHRGLAALSDHGRVILVPDADHAIQVSRPDAVVAAIRSVFDVSSPPTPVR